MQKMTGLMRLLICLLGVIIRINMIFGGMGDEGMDLFLANTRFILMV